MNYDNNKKLLNSQFQYAFKTKIRALSGKKQGFRIWDGDIYVHAIEDFNCWDLLNILASQKWLSLLEEIVSSSLQIMQTFTWRRRFPKEYPYFPSWLLGLQSSEE